MNTLNLAEKEKQTISQIDLIDGGDNWFYAKMPSRKVMYRSVSPDELVDIIEKGAIYGGLNRFNQYDRRREVFFGDVICDQLIHQGEEISRRIENKLSDHYLQDDYKEALEERSSIYKDLEDEFQYAYMYPAKEKKKIEKITKEIEKIKDAFKKLMTEELKAERDKNDTREYTSAIIETIPLDSGRWYSQNHGKGNKPGHGEYDEFGFESGSVDLDKISKIHFVKNKKIINVLDVDAAIDSIAVKKKKRLHP